VEEHVHRDRWLVSYADFMTLLFALFVVLFASAYRDRQTVRRVSAAVKNGFRELGAFASDSSGPRNQTSGVSRITGANPTGNAGDGSNAAPPNAGIDVTELNRKLKNALGKEIERQEIDMRVTPEGFVISLHELGFFNSGEARLMPGAAGKVKKIAAVLNQYGLDMRIEGHSDNVPIHNGEFNSNWELYTARAMGVAMMLMNESGVDPKRMSVAGYAQYHPTASNDTPEGRRANRRVDIVVVSSNKPAGAA